MSGFLTEFRRQDLDCLQQVVADQAFTNSKAISDVDGMVNALIFRALERNTGAVGEASALCTQTAVNPEIAALTQHQVRSSSFRVLCFRHFSSCIH